MWTNLFTVRRSAPVQAAGSVPDSTLSCVSPLDLSVVIPAYNEERRLPKTLESVHAYLSQSGKSFEIIVVDDGSEDRTSDVVGQFSQTHESVKLVTCPRNRGKGHALRVGVMSATGNLILIGDADGSAPIEELAKLEPHLSDGAHIAIGSRAKQDDSTRVVTSLHRRFIGRVFHGFVQTLLLPNLSDTQCGFKLFTADVAHDLFSESKIDGFGFDVEILYIGRLRGYKTEEVPINWHNVSGSKVNLFTDPPKMLLDVLSVACAGALGAYTRKMRHPEEPVPMTLADCIPLGILTLFSMFLLYWFKLYAGAGHIPSNDLPGHIALVERMMPQLLHFRLTFYDPTWFSGWAACQFYAPLAEALTAMLALVLTFCSHEPARWACHLGLWLGCAVLPWTMWYFALPLARKVTNSERLSVSDGILLSSSVCLTCFWFLNHDYQWHGIGAAGVMYVGLYSQLLAWQFLLLHAGALIRWLDGREVRQERLVILFFALLCLTHTLTSMFELGFVLLLSVWYSKDRLSLWRMHLIAIGLSCFWLLPAVVLSTTYAIPDIIRPQGDFFEIVLRYPLASLLRHIQDGLAWHWMPIDLATVEVDFMFVMFLLLQRIKRAHAATSFFIAVLLASFIASSAFIASSLPLTVHYYRIYGYTFLYLAALLSIVPLASVYCIYDIARDNYAIKAAAVGATLCLLAGGLYSTSTFPHPERNKIAATAKLQPTSFELQVFDYFKRQPTKGRVFIESFDDYEKFPFLQARYFESRLWKETGFETVNGLFIQSSQACRLADAAAFMANGNTWNCPYIFTKKADIGNATAFTQLKDFGITHLICRSDSGLVQTARNNGATSVQPFGPFTVVQISDQPAPKVLSPAKQLVAYYDVSGNLPFRRLDDYVFAHKELYSRVEIIDLTGRGMDSCPPQVSAVIVNEKPSTTQFVKTITPDGAHEIPVVHLQYKQYHLIDHYHVWYQHNFELDSYEDIERCLDHGGFVAGMSQLLDNMAQNRQNIFPITLSTQPQLQFAHHNQTIELDNLMPGQLVKLNYSYFPFWHSSDAQVFRGSMERLYVIPQATHATLRFDPWSSIYTWLGVLISIGSLLAMAGVWQQLWRAVSSSLRSYLNNI
jgi:dolichyl-phosphate beta-glucosyltransferase